MSYEYDNLNNGMIYWLSVNGSKSKRYGNANHMGLSKENDLNEGN